MIIPGVRAGGRGRARLVAALLGIALAPAGARAQVRAQAGPAPQAAGAPAPERAGACDAAAAGPDGTRLLIDVTGLHSRGGNVTVTVYGDQPARFLKHAGSLAIVRVPLAGTPVAGRAEACVALSRPGDYAIALYHDENDNHHFDRTLLGLPAEGYGFSNDAPTPFGPPSYRAARISVGPGTHRIAVRIRY